MHRSQKKYLSRLSRKTSKRIKRIEHQRWLMQCVLDANAPYNVLAESTVQNLLIKVRIADKSVELARHLLQELKDTK